MSNVIKLRKGLNINLKGKAVKETSRVELGKLCAVTPDDFQGVTPKVLVAEGDKIKAGDAVFIDKNCAELKFASPVSGTVTGVVRGERRKVLRITIAPDAVQEYVTFSPKNVETLKGEEVKAALLEAGLFGFIHQLPYAVVTRPDTAPKGIFVSALRDKPLSADFEYELEGNEAAFQAGLTALSKIAKTYLGIGSEQTATALTQAKDVTVTVFQGPCPAGNVGVQVNHIDPVNKGEVVWTVDPMHVIYFGRLFFEGKVDQRRRVAVAGSEVKAPQYVETVPGVAIAEVLKGRVAVSDAVRVINGNPLTGKRVGEDGFLSAMASEVTAIPEGDHADEMFGWMSPRLNDYSTSHSYFSWLFGRKKEYSLDARIKGGERHMIMSGEYDKVLPMDIYGEFLVKAIIAGDIEKQEQLGIYEVSPEDFALAEFVDSSKLELQKIIREGLDILRKENE